MFKVRFLLLTLLTMAVTSLYGCGGGGGSSGGESGVESENGSGDLGNGDASPPPPVSPSVSVSGTKTLTFSWEEVDADHYKLLKNPDGVSGYSQVGSDLVTTTVDETTGIHLQDWVNASYIVQACNAAGDCTDSVVVTATEVMLDAIGYIKASNTDAGDWFGTSVALSQDGSTLAVGAPQEASTATGINGDGNNNESNIGAGAVYVFSLNGTTWSQQAYIKASNINAFSFGSGLALSHDGNTLAVGAHLETNDATGIDGDIVFGGAASSGAVYVFNRSDTTWSQQAYIKAANTDALDLFGWSVALSQDGNTLAVGALYEASNATGIAGDASNNDVLRSGAVYLFGRSDTTWSQHAYIKASNTDEYDQFGHSVALSADGNTLAVGAVSEDSNATGVDGDAGNNEASASGAVYVFTRSDTNWSQQAYIKASNTGASDSFGTSVALSENGDALAVGATLEGSNARGINGDASNNEAPGAGAVYVYSRNGTDWSEQAYIKAANADADDRFGTSVALSLDGNTLAVGARFEGSNATGSGGNASNNEALTSGAAYMFTLNNATWRQQSYLKAVNTNAEDEFGFDVALSGDGHTLAVGATEESSNATGIGGDSSDNEASGSGAVYLY